jgi:toxin ParE1/3/4
MQILVRPAAAADIEDAFLWYEQQRPGLGAEFLQVVDRTLSAIATNPLIHATIHRDTRRALLRRFPYGVYYRVYPEGIVIVACMHGRRDPKRWESRSE